MKNVENGKIVHGGTVKARPKFNANHKDTDPKVAYICDGCGCDRQCANMRPEEWAAYQCHHTFDENHAANKVRRNRKFRCDRNPKTNEVVGYTEIER